MSVIINGITGIDKVQDGTITDAKLNLSANSQAIKNALNAGGSAPIYACRAWVHFNGTGTVAIRGSGNVSSITDNGTGDYTLNFTTAMPDNFYSANIGTSYFAGTSDFVSTKHMTFTSNNYRFQCRYASAAFDAEMITVSVIR